jgi:hypothetical protein
LRLATLVLAAVSLTASGRASADDSDSAAVLWQGGRAVPIVAGEAPEVSVSPGSRRIVVDLGEGWAPDVLSGGAASDGTPRPHLYESQFGQLARFELDESQQQHLRARQDRFLELYGIPPTLAVLRDRYMDLAHSRCVARIDLASIEAFPGSAVREEDAHAQEAGALFVLEPIALAAMARAQVWNPAHLDRAMMPVEQRRQLATWSRVSGWVRGLDAVRRRLACEGHLRGRLPDGPEYDPRTRAAVAEFERRHRIYARGALRGETLTALRTESLELERRAVVRVLTERAMLAAGFVEDGSAVDANGAPATYPLDHGQRAEVPNLEAAMREAVVAAFGLETPESTLAFLHELGELAPEGHRWAAFDGPEPPPYHRPEMALSAEIDRGDVWYDFPYDEDGRRRLQPIARRPTLTLYTTHRGERIPLVRYGTTIGSWRLERVRGQLVWRYKESPVGRRIWREVVSAPVWVPPPGTPDADLVTQIRFDDDGQPITEVKSNIVGPGYASAYGLIAGYHLRPMGRRTVDEGIRTHGSVDYTSISRRASHGCHRIHNHLALRLYTFVLHHRPHDRIGHRPVRYSRMVEYEGFRGELAIDRSGYVFVLRDPVQVEVLPGRVRGRARRVPTESHPWVPAHGAD